MRHEPVVMQQRRGDEQEDDAPDKAGDRDDGRVGDNLEVLGAATVPPTAERPPSGSALSRHLPRRGVTLLRLVPSDEKFALRSAMSSLSRANPIAS